MNEKMKKTKEVLFKNLTGILIAVAAVLLLLNQIQLTKLNRTINGVAGSSTFELMGKVDSGVSVDFYVMSYCPYGNQAEEALQPVFETMKKDVAFNPRYVIYSQYPRPPGDANYCIDADKNYCSMHGIQEANQDIRELCVNKYYGTDAFFGFALAMNDQCSASNADSCWQNVAKSIGLDVNEISKCQADEGLSLVAKEKNDGDVLGVRGSPQVFINGQEYNGARTAAGYQQAICNAFGTNKPASCGNLVEDTGTNSAVEGGCG